MKKRLAGYTAATITACLALGSLSTAYAATEVTLAGLGANVKQEVTAETEKKEEAKETKVTVTEPKETEPKETEAKETQPKETEVKAAEAEKAPETEAQTEVQTEAPVDRSMVNTTGFAKAEDYINVRAAGYAEADVVGTLSNLDSVYIEDVDADGWYKIRSGNVEGYVAGYLIATGAEAEEVAQSSAYTYAQVSAESLNVRADASSDAEVVDMAGPGSDLEVVEDLGDWVKVVTENGVYGYVSADYVSTETVYPTGETVQERTDREEAEYEAAVAQQQAEAEAQAAAYAAAQAQALEDMVSAMSPEVKALYDAYLAAQEAAMHPVDEADAKAKADAAIAAYNAYIAACSGTSVPAADTTAAADTAADDETDEDGYIDVDAEDDGEDEVLEAEDDDSLEDDEYVDGEEDGEDDGEDEYVDVDGDSEEDETLSAASTGSGLGAQIAAYATQFVGNPYVYGGASLTGGADCSGFTMAVFANFGIGLPHNAAAQSGCGTQVSLSDLQPGDLLFYDNGGGIGHVTLYIGNGQVVHASSPETGIKISAYNYRSPVCAVRCW